MDNEFQQEVREGFAQMIEQFKEMNERFEKKFKEMNERFEKKFEEIDNRLDTINKKMDNGFENIESYCRDNLFVLEQEIERKTDAILDKLDDNDRKFSENDANQDRQDKKIENHEYRLMKLELNSK